MADDANTYRKANIDLLIHQVKGLHRVLGLVIKSTRAYKWTGALEGLTQHVVEEG